MFTHFPWRAPGGTFVVWCCVSVFVPYLICVCIVCGFILFVNILCVCAGILCVDDTPGVGAFTVVFVSYVVLSCLSTSCVYVPGSSVLIHLEYSQAQLCVGVVCGYSSCTGSHFGVEQRLVFVLNEESCTDEARLVSLLNASPVPHTEVTQQY